MTNLERVMERNRPKDEALLPDGLMRTLLSRETNTVVITHVQILRWHIGPAEKPFLSGREAVITVSFRGEKYVSMSFAVFGLN